MRIKIIIPIVLLTVAASTALAVMTSRRKTPAPAPISPPLGSLTSAPPHVPAPAPRLPARAAPLPERVSRAHLWPHLRAALSAFGDRLERPGRERLILTGSLTRANESQSASLHLIREFPARFRLTQQSGAQLRTVIFHQGALETSGEADSFARALVETLELDTPEQFFSSRRQGAALRFLGSRARLDDGSTASYTGPFYDVYEATTTVRIGEQERRQTKLYYFNSDTLLLELVRYEADSNGSRVSVETRFGDWQQTDRQQVARLISRTENGQTVFTFTVTTASFAPRVADGAFGPASTR